MLTLTQLKCGILPIFKLYYFSIVKKYYKSINLSNNINIERYDDPT